MLWIQETSRCGKSRFSCWTEFGQAFSTQESKISVATPVVCRDRHAPLLNASRHLSRPEFNSDAQMQSTLKVIRPTSMVDPAPDS
jgi:hypothetical protein